MNSYVNFNYLSPVQGYLYVYKYNQKYFPCISKIFPVLQKKFPCFSLSGESKNQIPGSPRVVATLLQYLFEAYFIQNAVVTQTSPEKKSVKATAGSSQLKKSQSSLLAGAVKRKGYVILKKNLRVICKCIHKQLSLFKQTLFKYVVYKWALLRLQDRVFHKPGHEES